MAATERENTTLASEMPLIKEIIFEGINQPSPLLFMLHELQDKIGYVSEDAVCQISEALKILTPEALSFVTFHQQFKLKLKHEPVPIEARNIIRLCSGAPCHTKGSTLILGALCNLLNIQKGEVTQDKKFALELVDCLGTCGMSPVMMINEDIHGDLSAEQLPVLLNKYE